MKRRHFLGSLGTLAISASGRAQETKDIPVESQLNYDDLPPDVQVKGLGGYIAFSPDSKMLAVAAGPIEGHKKLGICFLDPATGKRLRDFERMTGIESGEDWPSALRFSPDGKYLAAGAKNYAALWETATGKRLNDITQEVNGSYSSLEFTPDSKALFVCNRFYTIPDGRLLKRPSDVDICQGVAFSPDNKLLAIRESGPITIWDWPEKAKSRITFASPSNWVAPGLTFVSDNILVSGFWRKAPDQEYDHQFWNTDTGRPIQEFNAFKGRIEHLAISRGDRLFAMPIWQKKGITLIKLDDRRPVASFRNTPAVHNEDALMEIAISASGDYLAVARTYIVEIWKTEKLLKTIAK